MAKQKREIPSPGALQESLYLTEGSSDKEYHARLVEKDAGWVVNFEYGRRGQALKAGTKTANPVDFATAYVLYADLVDEKKKKGYTPDVSGEVFQDTVAGENFSGFLPQLPQTVRQEADIETMLADSRFVMQEKHDGDNRQIRKADGQVQGINKRGMLVPLPMNLVDEAHALGAHQFHASGEIIGNRLFLFDLQELDGKDLRGEKYRTRLAKLEALVANQPLSGVCVVATARTPAEKAALVERIRAASGEGVVFKNADAPFCPGKLSASEAEEFKWKFTEDCTVRVKKANAGKRSVEVEIDHNGEPVALGNVSIPPNHDIPATGTLVSVVYQHLFEGGSLFQPQYKGVRTDCDGPDTLDMFKVKPKEQARRLAM